MIEEVLEALRAGDFVSVQRFVHPDIELDLSRRVLNPEVFHGTEGLTRWRSELYDVWDDMRLEADEVIENGDKVFIRFRAALRGKGSGITTEGETFHVWTVRDGLIAQIVLTQERGEAEQLAGLG